MKVISYLRMVLVVTFVVCNLSSANAAPRPDPTSASSVPYAPINKYLDLKVWTEPNPNGIWGKIIHIQDIGNPNYTAANDEYFDVKFRARSSNSNTCYKLDRTEQVPFYGDEIIITVTDEDLNTVLTSVPIYYDVIINKAHNPAESDYTNNREGNFNSVSECATPQFKSLNSMSIGRSRFILK